MNKFLLCATVLILISATSAADAAYARRTIGGGTVVRGAGVYSGRYHDVRRGVVYRGYRGPAAVGVGAATSAWGWNQGWGWNQPWGWNQGWGQNQWGLNYGRRCTCY